jgi:cytolysin-activating lysine-acyltransferase
MWGKRTPGHDEELLSAGASPSPEVASANEQLLGTQSVAGLRPKAQPNGAESTVINGVDGMATAVAPNRASQGPTPEEIRFAVTFTRIVSVLTRSPHYKHYTLSDLEWLVVPPLLTGQCAVMEAKVNGRDVPVAVALWATVSDEVDKRLSENVATPIRLRPDEWRSGDVLWLVDAVGDPKAVPILVTQIRDAIFKERTVKVRRPGPDSQPVVEILNAIVHSQAFDRMQPLSK